MATVYRNNITQLTQLALRDYIRAQALSFIAAADTDTSIVAGISAATEIRPLIVVLSKNAETGADVFDGNWAASVEVVLRSNADDTSEDDHHAHAGELFSIFLADPLTVADAISAAYADYQCEFIVPKAQGWDIEERSWVSFMRFTVNGFGHDAA